MKTLCIDATNLTEGGGITHLKEILSAVKFESTGFNQVIIYSSYKTLDQLPEKEWLIKKSNPLLNQGLMARSWFLFFNFKKELINDNCSILFNPGGGYAGVFRPFVTMCRNMLVFDTKERSRYKYGKIYWRLYLLELLQSASLKRANGVVFISTYAMQYVTNKIQLQNPHVIKINHGISERFHKKVNPQKHICEYTPEAPFKLLYVSIVDLYKHQWQVATAVHALKTRDGFNIELQLVGSSNKQALKKLNKVITETKSESYIQYMSNLSYNQLHATYHDADAFVFASSCENMPNILLEAMSAGLPIACSNSQPMPEFLKDAGWYFNPEDDESIYHAIKEMLLDPAREKLAVKAIQYAGEYSWKKCADTTFNFLYNLTEKK